VAVTKIHPFTPVVLGPARVVKGLGRYQAVPLLVTDEDESEVELREEEEEEEVSKFERDAMKE
jgi:hypothetical protein